MSQPSLRNFVILPVAMIGIASCLVAQTPPKQGGTVSKMVSAYRSIHTFSDSVSTVRTVDEKPVRGSMQVSAQRPNQFLLEIKGDKMNTLIANDGVSTLTYLADRKAYLKSHSAPLLMGNDPLAGTDVPLLSGKILSAFLSNTVRDGSTPVAKMLNSAPELGTATIGGVNMHVLGFEGPEGLSGKIYISDADYLIRKVTLSQADKVVYEETHTVTTNEALPAGTFNRTVPANASLVLNLPKMDPIQFIDTSAEKAADFTAEALHGGSLHLSDFKGKVVVLDFWATWCVPCQKSMPHIEQVYRGTKGQDIVVLGLCVWDDHDAYDQWMPEHKSEYTFKFAFDTNAKNGRDIAKKLYGVDGIPTTVVIDKEGRVVDKIVGFAEGDTRLEKSLKKVGINVN
ncbi:MAG: redoxin domain-containing protein [Chthonomonadales bacterium]